jgi:YfiR/HmsC-like
MVGDVKNFAKVGGIINFVTVKKKIYMEINIDTAQKAGLKISSMLLGVSKIIRDNSIEGDD